MSLITISGSLGSGGREIARILAQKLAIELYDDAHLQREAERLNLATDELAYLDLKAPGFFERVFSHKPQLYQDIMESLVYEVSRHGEGVILGHGSQFLLRDFDCALHVLVFASESIRVERISRIYGLSADGSRTLVKKSDHEHQGYLKYAFQIDWGDPSHYDLLINTEKLGTESAVDLIANAAVSQTIRECSLSALETMERRALAKRIEAELLRRNLRFTHLQIEVGARGSVRISGFTLSDEDRRSAEKIARSVAGVNEVKSELVKLQAGVS